MLLKQMESDIAASAIIAVVTWPPGRWMSIQLLWTAVRQAGQLLRQEVAPDFSFFPLFLAPKHASFPFVGSISVLKTATQCW